jgi:hypothetical protein
MDPFDKMMLDAIEKQKAKLEEQKDSLQVFCIKCEEEMTRFYTGGMLDFGPGAYYCENKKCTQFGILTVGVIVENKG